MTEDLDKDLEDLDLSDDSFDLDGLDDAAGGDEDAGIDLGGLDDAGGDEDAGGGDEDAGIDLSGLDDAGGDEDAGGGDEHAGGLNAADLDGLGDAGKGEDSSSGGDSLDLDAELQSMLDESEGGGGDTEAAGAGGESEEALGGGADGVEKPPPPALPAMDLSEEQTVNLEFLLDIKLHVTFEVGRAKMLISDLLTLGQGSVIELHRLVGDDLDMLVNGKLVARGEVVVVNEKFGCKINEIVPPDQRVKYMGNI